MNYAAGYCSFVMTQDKDMRTQREEGKRCVVRMIPITKLQKMPFCQKLLWEKYPRSQSQLHINNPREPLCFPCILKTPTPNLWNSKGFLPSSPPLETMPEESIKDSLSNNSFLRGSEARNTCHRLQLQAFIPAVLGAVHGSASLTHTVYDFYLDNHENVTMRS